MNILFIAPYRQSDGWSEAARAYAKALATTGHNITLRPIYMASNQIDLQDELLLNLEKNKRNHYDIIIQKVLPHLVDPVTPNAKTINLCVFETANLQSTPWIYYINLVDELWTTSSIEKKNIINSGVTIPVQYINQPVDISMYEQQYDTSHWHQFGFNDNFVFYFIGEYIPRKNLKALATAFHREFRPSEPVELVIKTNRMGLNIHQLTSQIDQDFSKIQSDLKLYQDGKTYKSEWVIAEFIPLERLNALHQVCDCFIMPSYGESMCRPMLDALGFGNPVIVTDNTGMCDYVTPDVGRIVDSRTEPVYSSDHPLPYLYTGWETWQSIDILSLQKSMREIYELNGLQKAQIKSRCKEHIKQFSYEKVGQRINRLL